MRKSLWRSALNPNKVYYSKDSNASNLIYKIVKLRGREEIELRFSIKYYSDVVESND